MCPGPDDAGASRDLPRDLRTRGVSTDAGSAPESSPGLLSECDLRLVLPSPATSLAAHEVHYLLERLTVAEIMTRFPVTIGPDHALTEAASRMHTHHVQALPVTEHRRLVGILTRAHLLYAFIRAQATQPLAA